MAVDFWVVEEPANRSLRAIGQHKQMILQKYLNLINQLIHKNDVWYLSLKSVAIIVGHEDRRGGVRALRGVPRQADHDHRALARPVHSEHEVCVIEWKL